MVLQGRVTYQNDPMTISLRGMNMQIHMMEYTADNIANADMVGYQKKIPIVTSFAETLGIKGVDTQTDTSVGRIQMTDKPLDLALGTKGYFQKLQPDGRIDMTRDGRFKLDKSGNLLSEDNLPILGKDGSAIRMPFIPDSLSQIKIDFEGRITLANPATGKTESAGTLSVVDGDGTPAKEVQVTQGYVESSNVFLHEEFVAMVAPKRNFQANRQMFLTQSQALGRLIQELGRVQ